MKNLKDVQSITLVLHSIHSILPIGIINESDKVATTTKWIHFHWPTHIRMHQLKKLGVSCTWNSSFLVLEPEKDVLCCLPTKQWSKGLIELPWAWEGDFVSLKLLTFSHLCVLAFGATNLSCNPEITHSPPRTQDWSQSCTSYNTSSPLQK